MKTSDSVRALSPGKAKRQKRQSRLPPKQEKLVLTSPWGTPHSPGHAPTQKRTATVQAAEQGVHITACDQDACGQQGLALAGLPSPTSSPPRPSCRQACWVLSPWCTSAPSPLSASSHSPAAPPSRHLIRAAAGPGLHNHCMKSISPTRLRAQGRSTSFFP